MYEEFITAQTSHNSMEPFFNCLRAYGRGLTADLLLHLLFTGDTVTFKTVWNDAVDFAAQWGPDWQSIMSPTIWNYDADLYQVPLAWDEVTYKIL